MRELQRVLGDKRVIIVFVLILIINGLLFYQSMQPDSSLEQQNKELYGDDYRKNAEEKKEYYFDYYGKMDVDTACKELKSRLDEIEQEREEFDSRALEVWDGTGELPQYIDTLDIDTRLEQSAIQQIYSTYLYISGYQESVELIIGRAEEQAGEENIFRKDSFAGRNIRKTGSDYSRVRDVTLKVDTEEAFNAVAAFSLGNLLMVLPVAVVVIVILDERKKGLWEFVHTTPGGRKKLAVQRIGIMIFAALAAVVVFTGENLLIAGIVNKGYGDITRSIQSIQICRNITLPINVLEYFLLTTMMTVLMVSMAGLVLLVLALIGNNYIKGFILTAVLTAAEYIAWVKIGANSKWAWLKRINLFRWVDSGECLRDYENINIMGYPVGQFLFGCISMAVICCILMAAVILAGEKYPVSSKRGILTELLQTLEYRLKLYRHNCIFLHELYRQVIAGKLWIVILASILFSIAWHDTKAVSTDYYYRIYNNYMEMLQGNVTQEKLDYLKKEDSLWQKQIKTQEKEIEETTDEILIAARQRRLEELQISDECVQDILTEAEHLNELQEQGENVVLTAQTGYERYMGKESEEQSLRKCIVLLLFGVLFTAPLISRENAENTVITVRSMKYGRGRYIAAKAMVLFTELFIVFGCIEWSLYDSAQQKYGMNDMWASIRSLSFYDGLCKGMNIGMVLFLQLAVRFLILYACMSLYAALTYKMKNVMAAALMGILVFVLPACVYMMGYGQMAVFTLADEMMTGMWL